MSNLANYSPYNKTYKFLLLQNQAYHEKNKITAKPCVRTNLRYTKISTSFSMVNPELNKSDMPQDLTRQSPKRCQSPTNSIARSMMFTSRSLRESSPQIAGFKRIIHKNQSFEKFSNMRIMQANSKLVSRLVSTSCQVLKRKTSVKSFQKHLKYRQIRNKYDPQGNRKHGLVVGNEQLLCPTLKEYNESGMASKFIESNLSWSKVSTQGTRMRKKLSSQSAIQ